jgi:ankyrin repeat protein
MNDALFDALEALDVGRIQRLVKRKHAGHPLDEEEWTLLHYLVHYPSLASLVPWAVAEGGEVNARTSFGSTPLHLVTGRDLSFASVLCAHGAKLDVFNRHGHTPLHLAVQRGDERMVRFLLDHGADPDACDPRFPRRTPSSWFPYLSWDIRLAIAELFDQARGGCGLK